MAFETFYRQRAPLSVDPMLTIQRRGNFSINAAAHTALGEPEAVEFLYDRDEKRMGIRKVQPLSESAYAVRPNGKSSWIIAGMAFTQYYGIPSDVARRWIGRLEGDILVFDLNEEGKEVVSNRRLKERSPVHG